MVKHYISVNNLIGMATLVWGVVFTPAYASECSKTVNIGVVADWPPLTAFDQLGPWGLDVDIAEMVFQHVSICTNYIRLPSSARTFEEMTKGVIDVAVMVSYTKDRERYGDFTLPYRFERMRLFSLSPAMEIPSLESLVKQTKTIGLSIGSFYGQELATLKNDTRYKEQFVGIASAKRRIEMLMKRRVDFVVDDVITGSYFINEQGLDSAKAWPYVVHDNQVHFLLRNGVFSPRLISKINDAIVQLKPKIELLVSTYQSSLILDTTTEPNQFTHLLPVQSH
ncbi:transporter substrate-binding domain-containing protein [Pseudoalteromonas sp. McH1-7]|uniref:substrate-binding periplasmic protein n=1 Tax=Pseudoalteromonas TaxID=53246 RepID=UPI001592AA61|nr:MULTISPECIES: transporter substrate-binding domain-containing protein [Pseudoalteromonas]MDW7548711.1 transporter substrate-binding domain-containing protein [Pseudoalteromonas peptidolytica]NUZ10870.1 transporter substrate-binding domain-containing protein [Pseudoalteromonas sp. McH1-7]USD30559.1 transporter substrate-binding domain-containing protein [Pseudoalteromonas sp. SCSIO 43201]